MLSKKQIPNFLTYFRVAAIPLVAYAISQNEMLAAFWLFVFASLTDFLDGYLARKWQLETKFGAMIDQISDKLLVSAILIAMVSVEKAPLACVIIIISREVFVSGLREFMSAEGVAMPVSRLGKWKTATQLVGLSFLLLPVMVGSVWHSVGELLLWVSAVLAVITAYQYAKFS